MSQVENQQVFLQTGTGLLLGIAEAWLFHSPNGLIEGQDLPEAESGELDLPQTKKQELYLSQQMPCDTAQGRQKHRNVLMVFYMQKEEEKQAEKNQIFPDNGNIQS